MRIFFISMSCEKGECCSMLLTLHCTLWLWLSLGYRLWACTLVHQHGPQQDEVKQNNVAPLYRTLPPNLCTAPVQSDHHVLVLHRCSLGR